VYVTLAECALVGIVTVFVFVVLSSSSVPLQPLICQPESGVAPLKVIDSPET
jgi:hypothetical protein